MTVRVVVPRRADGGHRDRLWAHCRQQWPDEWELVEGHHETGPFNRSAAINQGAEGAWEVVVIVDADVLVDLDRVRDALALALESGAMVLPYQRRMLVGVRGTRAVIDDGYTGPLDALATPDRNRGHVSSCVVVPRDLWDEVRGCDPRFQGWGAEDDAFYAACLTLGEVRRTDGVVWHLHHAPSPEKNFAAPLYQQSKLLLARYQQADTPDAMRRLIAERDGSVVVAVLTNGRRDTLAKTVHSIDETVHGPISRKLLIAEQCTPEVEGWETVRIRGGNYTKAVAAAWEVMIGSGQPWVFFSEDDFVFEADVDLTAMIAVMEAEPRLAQLALKRQPWYQEELDAGGVIEERTRRGDVFHQRDGWVQHAAYWTQNPMLTRRRFLAEHPWPRGSGSENRFGRLLFDGDCDPVAGIWGAIEDPPVVTHIGVERAGSGY